MLICAMRALPSTKGESLERVFSGAAASIINHLGKLGGESWSVSESSDPGHDLFVYRLVDGVLVVLVLMIMESFRQSRPTPATESQQGARGPKYLAPSHGGYETAIARLGRCQWVTQN